MKTILEVDGKSYELSRRRGQRNLRVHLDPSGKVIISAPYYASGSEIRDFVRRTRPWVEKNASKVSEHSYQTGDFVPYLGRKLNLIVIEGKMSHYDIIDDKLMITARDKDIEKVKSTIRRLYFDTVGDIIGRRVPFWCGKLGLEIPPFEVNRAKRKWGVCYLKEKRICISYMCATIPEDLIDMTCLHEVCHLVNGNHNVDFWNLMRRYMADLDERKTSLNSYSKSGWALNIV